MLVDAYQRQIKDLRVSLTDRCNFRCFYCLPNGEPPLARKETILTFEEIVEVCEIFVSLGIEKIRLTGGEPLLRKDVETLVEKLALLKLPGSRFQVPGSKFQIPSLQDLALTTNGFSLSKRAENLKKAGLDRVTISLDSLKEDNFRRITGVAKLAEVLDAIEAAKRADLKPIKINAVIVRGVNDDEIVDFARFARENAVSMRFIEYMPLDSQHEWRREQVVAGREIFAAINEAFPLRLKEDSRGSETAWRYKFQDGAEGEIGIIAPGYGNVLRSVFADSSYGGRANPDLSFSVEEHNLRDILRDGASRKEIIEFIREVVFQKEARHFINDKTFAPASRSMSFIGG